MKNRTFFLLALVVGCTPGDSDGVRGHGGEIAAEDTGGVMALPGDELAPPSYSYTFTVPNNPTYPNCSKALQLTATAQGGGKILSVKPNDGDTYSTTAGVSVSQEKWFILNGNSWTIDKDLNSTPYCVVLGPRTATVTYTGSRPRLQYYWTDCWCDHD